jgi:hypothetical protein
VPVVRLRVFAALIELHFATRRRRNVGRDARLAGDDRPHGYLVETG